MTDTFLAQCPYCHASFRLKRSQLTAARGSVRCGACLKVFNAASQVTAQQLQPDSILSANDGFESLATFNADAAEAEPTRSVTPPPPTANQDPFAKLDLDAELARLEREEQLSKNALNKQRCPAKPQTAVSSQDHWHEEVLAQATARPLAGAHAVSAQKTASTAQPSNKAKPLVPEHEQDDFEPPLTASRSVASQHFIDAPIQLNWRAKKNPWPGRLLWTALSVCAALLLVGQYSVHNFTELARQDSTRPWLEAICPLINCQLPDKVDVRYIKSSNLMVRNHPTFSGALQVDAIIYNRAPFSQPFPLLELTFSNQHDQLIAKRLFTPNEYLAGELAGQHAMPPQVPIHIALEVLNPSSGVLSYQLDFVSPDSPKAQR